MREWEESLQEPALSFCHVGPGDQIRPSGLEAGSFASRATLLASRLGFYLLFCTGLQSLNNQLSVNDGASIAFKPRSLTPERTFA